MRYVRARPFASSVLSCGSVRMALSFHRSGKMQEPLRKMNNDWLVLSIYFPPFPICFHALFLRVGFSRHTSELSKGNPRSSKQSFGGHLQFMRYRTWNHSICSPR